ncbi:hypothetical protein CMZ84_11785 [Lysobacteraceae bacterium NML93-0399]|nr:hypothetical protein CMZ84_11785 [Xanthomonadaceae bacterium NML93-0399]
MRRAIAAILIALIPGAAMQPAFAQSTVAPQHPGDPGYDALLAAATAPVRDAFDGAVRVDVERLDRLGRWAFLQGTLRDADGGRPDYAGTRYAERATQGGMSDVYVALLQAPQAAAEAEAPDQDPAAAPTSDEEDGMENAASADARTDAPSDAPGPAADAASEAWTLVDHSIGPSDVSWLNWPTEHAAPRQLFGF